MQKIANDLKKSILIACFMRCKEQEDVLRFFKQIMILKINWSVANFKLFENDYLGAALQKYSTISEYLTNYAFQNCFFW